MAPWRNVRQPTLVDDIDRTDIPRGLGKTIRFGVDGRTYEVDLSDDYAAGLREALRPFKESGRRLAPTRGRS